VSGVRLVRLPSLREFVLQLDDPARWRDRPVSDLRLSYARAAAVVLGGMMQADAAAPGSGGTLLPPYLFLWRHHIELALKSILELLEEDPAAWQSATGQALPPGLSGQAQGEHSLEHLWNLVSPWVVTVWSREAHLWHLPRMTPTEVGDLIRQFHQIDPNGQDARYDRDTSGSPTMLGVNRVDLHWTESNMQGIAEFLAWALVEIGAVMGIRASEAESRSRRRAELEAAGDDDGA
jgi:hypothetical protein